jgi:hypothetical protein
VDYSYEVGLKASIGVGGIPAAIVLITTVALVIYVAKPRSAWEWLLAIVTMAAFGTLYTSITWAVVFCAAFTILNPWLQYEELAPTLIPAFIERELGNGVFALRIASLFICYRSLGYVAQLIWVYALHYHENDQDKRRRRFFDQASEKYPALKWLRQDVRDEDQDLINLSQWGLYAMVLTDLWVLTILPQGLPRGQSILVALLSFGLFFIFDDWTIISEYARTLRGRILPWHAIRIFSFNLVLIGLLLYVVFQQFSWAGTITSVVVIGILLFWRYGYKRAVAQPWWEYVFSLRPPRRPAP